VFAVDKDRLRALHGNAVLSRYPIRSARLVPFTIGCDWFKEPHFARTLVNLNNCPPEPIADHSPMTVDLPFGEPSQLRGKVKAQ
jgi:hypothetical protein